MSNDLLGGGFAVPRLSSEMLHATTVVRQGRAVMITGPSGSGKSDLALRLIERDFQLVSDDQTLVHRQGERLFASAPPTIAGKLEVRGLGIVEIDHLSNQPIALVVELTSDIERLPADDRGRLLLGLKLPLINIDAMAASAAAKTSLALERIGLTFE